MNKPTTIDEYKEWLKSEHSVEITKQNRTYFDSVAHKIAKDFKNSPFWTDVLDTLDTENQRYFLANECYLLIEPNPPEIETKSFESFLLKTFRKNVLSNSNWPNPPKGGWLLPCNWLECVNDIVRTYFVLKFLDGVTFFATTLETLAEKHGLQHTIDYEAKEEGYYAAHFYVIYKVEIPTQDWDTEVVPISIEIQLTTQLQEVIRNLLHKYYEERRKEGAVKPTKWQWDYTTDEFSTNYLGHILHYVEGMIMDIRKKQSKGDKT